MYWFLIGMLKNSMQKYFFFDRFNLNFMQGFLSSSLFNFLYEPVALFGRKLEKCFLTEEENIFKRVRRFYLVESSTIYKMYMNLIVLLVNKKLFFSPHIFLTSNILNGPCWCMVCMVQAYCLSEMSCFTRSL